jgi:nucleotide-binding universal stress UspA family protein
MTHTASSSGATTSPSREPAVVVGVDGSERNQAAIDWATAEAARAGRELRLVTVAAVPVTSPPAWPDGTTMQYAIDESTKIADRVRRRILPTWDRTRVEVPCGSPVIELVDATRPGDLLVLGRRGLGSVQRVVLGSTSIAVAGRASVPTVIVPDDWDQTERDSWPVVAGVDGTERDGAVLDFAFRRARDLGVTLLVIGAWETPLLYDWEGLDYETAPWTKDAEVRLAERLEEWTSRFPEVDLACYAPSTSAADALLRDGRDAQLVVLGRRAGAHELTGFSGFSTCRRVLHHAVTPVAVVPATAVEPRQTAFDETDEPQF